MAPIIPIIASVVSGILSGNKGSGAGLAKLALGMAGNSARSTNNNMPEPKTIGG